jgi:dTDP-4-amino-4,6-dideoxygalactose transaminase/UDP-N-acetylmuramyl pentapeptide phosphotransferase/UDP-N-acetylglucosamine-1-phosphate transferase
MIAYLTWLICGWALGALGVLLAREFAIRKKWLDYPNQRSFHDAPTPRIGGIGMLLPVAGGVCIFMLLEGRAHLAEWLLLLLPALLVALLSYFDDRFDLSRAVRFSGHTLFALMVLWFFRSTWIGAPLPLLGAMLPAAVVAVLLVVWITGLTNAYNFMDGIDGISAVQGMVITTGWITVLLWEASGDAATASAQMVILLLLTGGLLGFLLLNWAPATIFLGDIGSTFLGFYFAALPFGAGLLGLPFDRALEAGVFFAWPFIADSSVTLIRRLIRRERIFDAHRTHFYQILAASYATRDQGHRMTSLFYGLLGLVGIGLYWTSGPLWAKLGVMAWIWLAVGAWILFLRAPKANQRSRWTVAKSSADDRVNPSAAKFFPESTPFDIYLSPPETTESERRRVIEALDSGFIAPVGPQVNAFEQDLARYLGLPEMQAVSSGTAAIHLGLRALGVGPGDCVLCPDLTFIASVNPVRYLGAEPVLVDVTPDNWAMDPDLAREAIDTMRREGRVIRAMVVVHAFGVPAPMDALMELANEAGIPVLEDCAGAFGSRYGEHSVGTFGAAAAFSFNGNKVLTTSGGGALFVRDKKVRQAARSWANQGKAAGAVGYVHETLGYNYKLSNISAAIGLGQLETVDRRLARKAAIFREYKERLGGIAEVSFMPEPVYGKNNYWLSSMGVDTRTHAEDIVTSVRKHGIEAAPMWKPMHIQGLNRELRCFGGAVSERIHRTHFSLPCGSALTDPQLERICELVREQLAACVCP